MPAPSIIAIVDPANADVSQSLSKPTDSGSQAFADVLSGVRAADQGSSSGPSDAENSASTYKGASQVAGPVAPVNDAASAVPTSIAHGSRFQPQPAASFTKAALAQSSAATPAGKTRNASPLAAENVANTASSLTISATVQIPITAPLAPDPLPATASTDVNATNSRATVTTNSGDGQDNRHPASAVAASGTDPVAFASADVSAANSQTPVIMNLADGLDNWQAGAVGTSNTDPVTIASTDLSATSGQAPVITNSAPEQDNGQTAGIGATSETDPVAIASADVSAASSQAPVITNSVAEQDNGQTGGIAAASGTNVEAAIPAISIGAPSAVQNGSSTDGTSGGEGAQPLATPVLPTIQTGEGLDSSLSAKLAARANRGSVSQSGATAQDSNKSGGPVALQAQPQATVTASDTSFETTTTFDIQKHNFVATALRDVSNAVSSAMQTAFTAAGSEFAKMPAPAQPISLPNPSIGPQAAAGQSASGGGSGAGSGSNSRSASDLGNAQSGSSPSAGVFSTSSPVDSSAPAQSANEVPIGAMKADGSTSGPIPGDGSVSTTASERNPATPDSTTSSQTAASSDSALVGGAASPDAQISQAHLFERSGGAEMRISLNTETLGPIELRATSDKDRIGAVITAAKPETQDLLNNELPTLHQALSERNLQIQQLSVSHGSLAGGMSGRGGYSQSPDAWQKQAAGNYWQPSTESDPSPEDIPGAVVSAAVPGKLSVHA